MSRTYFYDLQSLSWIGTRSYSAPCPRRKFQWKGACFSSCHDPSVHGPCFVLLGPSWGQIVLMFVHITDIFNKRRIQELLMVCTRTSFSWSQVEVNLPSYNVQNTPLVITIPWIGCWHFKWTSPSFLDGFFRWRWETKALGSQVAFGFNSQLSLEFLTHTEGARQPTGGRGSGMAKV